MSMDDIAIIQTERGYSMPLTLQPERFRSALYASAQATRIRWWKARLDVGYVDTEGEKDFDSEAGKWVWDEQVTGDYRAVVRSEKSSRRYSRAGEQRNWDVMITFMPDELPLGDHDLIQPIGRVDNILPDTRIDEYKESLVRGEIKNLLDGTVSSVTTAVTGVGTTFSDDLRAGQVIQAGGQMRKISAIIDDTHLTLSLAPSPAWNTNKVSLCRERLARPDVVKIGSVTRGATVYTEGVDYRIGVDNQTLEWYATQPAPGERYSIHYYCLPRYIIQYNLGTNPHVVNTVSPMQSVVARLYTPPGINR